jgi:flagellar biosynthetic protein FliO
VVDAPSTGELLVRLVFSLGIILGLLLLAAKVARRNGRTLRLPGIGSFGGKRRDPVINVIERTSLSKNASLAVVQVGDRTMVVGITDHEVSLLTDQVDLAVTTDDGYDDDDTADGTDEPVAGVTQISAMRGAKGTLPLPSGSAALDAVAKPDRPPRMSFVDALREMTVRSA